MSKFVGTGPSFYTKRIYRTAVSQRLGNTGLENHHEAVKNIYLKANMHTNYTLFRLTDFTVSNTYLFVTDVSPKGRAIPLQARTGPEGSRRVRPPDFKTIGT